MSVKQGRINGSPSIIATHAETEQEAAAYALYREAALVLCQIRGILDPDADLKIEVPSRIQSNVKQYEVIKRWKTLVPEIMGADHILMALSVTRQSRMPTPDADGSVNCQFQKIETPA